MLILYFYMPLICFLIATYYLAYYTKCNRCKRRIYRVSDSIYRKVSKYIVVHFRCNMCQDESYSKLNSKFAKNLHFKLALQQLSKAKRTKLETNKKLTDVVFEGCDFQVLKIYDLINKEIKYLNQIKEQVYTVADRNCGIYQLINKTDNKKYLYQSKDINKAFQAFLKISKSNRRNSKFEILLYCNLENLKFLTSKLIKS